MEQVLKVLWYYVEYFFDNFKKYGCYLEDYLKLGYVILVFVKGVIFCFLEYVYNDYCIVEVVEVVGDMIIV